jgi:hypothetical protein
MVEAEEAYEGAILTTCTSSLGNVLRENLTCFSWSGSSAYLSSVVLFQKRGADSQIAQRSTLEVVERVVPVF